jgi:hypothetical protein
MIVWRGRGVVIALIAFGSSLAAEVFTRARFHDEHYYQRHSWPILVAFLVAAVIVWCLESPYTPPTDQPLKDLLQTPGLPAPFEEREKPRFRVAFFRPSDSLFFIPARFWPLILCAIGVLFYFIPSGSSQ